MKIEIKCNDSNLVLTSEHLDNNNFIDLYYGGGANVVTVPIDELYSAVVSFKVLQNERKEM